MDWLAENVVIISSILIHSCWLSVLRLLIRSRQLVASLSPIVGRQGMVFKLGWKVRLLTGCTAQLDQLRVTHSLACRMRYQQTLLRRRIENNSINYKYCIVYIKWYCCKYWRLQCKIVVYSESNVVLHISCGIFIIHLPRWLPFYICDLSDSLSLPKLDSLCMFRAIQDVVNLCFWPVFHTLLGLWFSSLCLCSYQYVFTLSPIKIPILLLFPMLFVQE